MSRTPSLRASPRLVLVAATLIGAAAAVPARAEPSAPPGGSASGDATVASAKRGLVFPPWKKRAPAPSSAIDARPSGAGPDPNAVASEPPAAVPPVASGAPAEGIWDWVDRMDGEIPSPEQVAAVVEVAAEQVAELPVTDALAGGQIPMGLYEDPFAAVAVAPGPALGFDRSEFDIPVEMNASVEKWIRYFTGSGRPYYERWLARSSRFQPMMRAALAEAGLPQDLVYLSMIESGYNTNAYSHADAAGLWQFIPSTGKAYDLRIDWWVDDRRDPELALDAAVTFLGELHHMFGDWRLAWASYNGGPGRVRRAVERSGSKDFWTLADGGYLHPETANYVPKIMAAAIVGKHPERYGFEGIRYQDALAYDVVDVNGSVALEVLARCAGTTVDDLKTLNPGLRRYATPPEGYAVRVPSGNRDRFVAALADVPMAERGAVVRHTVHRGETLAEIAAKYGSSVDAISHANQLKNIDRIVVGMNLVIPPGDGARPPADPAVMVAKAEPKASPKAHAAAAPAPADSGAGDPRIVAASMATIEAPSARVSPKPARPPAPKPAPAPKPVTHTVARGDSLSTLASRYHTTVAAIQAENGLKSSTILLGQKLKIPASGSAEPEPIVHVVQKGEWLRSIADKYGVSAEDVLAWNALSDPSHIEVGQKLTIHPAAGGGGAPAKAPAWTQYQVKAGDSLTKIANAHGCSVADLRAWNELGTASVIQPGQKLKIKGS